jgi:hypothetical protein
LLGWPEFEVGYEHGVIFPRGNGFLVVGAEGPEGELGRRSHRVEPPPTSLSAAVRRVGERQVALSRSEQLVGLEVFAEQVTPAVHRVVAEKRG